MKYGYGVVENKTQTGFGMRRRMALVPMLALVLSGLVVPRLCRVKRASRQKIAWFRKKLGPLIPATRLRAGRGDMRGRCAAQEGRLHRGSADVHGTQPRPSCSADHAGRGGVLPEIHREGVCRVPEGRMRKFGKILMITEARRSTGRNSSGKRSGAWTAWSCSFCRPAARI